MSENTQQYKKLYISLDSQKQDMIIISHNGPFTYMITNRKFSEFGKHMKENENGMSSIRTWENTMQEKK